MSILEAQVLKRFIFSRSEDKKKFKRFAFERVPCPAAEIAALLPRRVFTFGQSKYCAT